MAHRGIGGWVQSARRDVGSDEMTRARSAVRSLVLAVAMAMVFMGVPVAMNVPPAWVLTPAVYES